MLLKDGSREFYGIGGSFKNLSLEDCTLNLESSMRYCTFAPPFEKTKIRLNANSRWFYETQRALTASSFLEAENIDSKGFYGMQRIFRIFLDFAKTLI